MKVQYKEGYKYQITSNYFAQVDVCPDENVVTEFIELTTDGLLFIRSGYACDGPSGPTWDRLWRKYMRGPFEHDALYQLTRNGHISRSWRAVIDKRLRTVCLQDGMCKIRAWYVYHAVRLAAGFAADPESRKKIYVAP